MEHDTASPTPDGDSPIAANPATPARPVKKRGLLLAVIGLALLVIGSLAIWLNREQKQSGNPSSPAAENLLFEAFTAAAGQQKVHFTYAERKFNSLADRQQNTTASEEYSVAEADNTTKEFRSAFISQTGSSAGSLYEVSRCLGGQVYAPKTAARVETLQAAKDALGRPLEALPAGDSSRAEGCKLTDDPRNGRLTDGIIPIGLTQQQITAWLQQLKDAQFLQLKDEGTTTYNGMSVYKLRLVTNSLAGVGSFYEAVKSGAGLQLTDAESGEPGPDAYRLDDIPGLDNVDGFYLIDKTTKLPVYSEFTTAALLNNKSGYVFKQAYQYPQELTLSNTTSLDILE